MKNNKIYLKKANKTMILKNFKKLIKRFSINIKNNFLKKFRTNNKLINKHYINPL